MFSRGKQLVQLSLARKSNCKTSSISDTTHDNIPCNKETVAEKAADLNNNTDTEVEFSEATDDEDVNAVVSDFAVDENTKNEVDVQYGVNIEIHDKDVSNMASKTATNQISYNEMEVQLIYSSANIHVVRNNGDANEMISEIAAYQNSATKTAVESDYDVDSSDDYENDDDGADPDWKPPTCKKRKLNLSNPMDSIRLGCNECLSCDESSSDCLSEEETEDDIMPTKVQNPNKVMINNVRKTVSLNIQPLDKTNEDETQNTIISETMEAVVESVVETHVDPVNVEHQQSRNNENVVMQDIQDEVTDNIT